MPGGTYTRISASMIPCTHKSLGLESQLVTHQSAPDLEPRLFVAPATPVAHRRSTNGINTHATKAKRTSVLPCMTDCCTLANGSSNAVPPSMLKVRFAPGNSVSESARNMADL